MLTRLLEGMVLGEEARSVALLRATLLGFFSDGVPMEEIDDFVLTVVVGMLRS